MSTAQITVRLNTDMLETLRSAAKANERSLAAQITFVLRPWCRAMNARPAARQALSVPEKEDNDAAHNRG